MVLEGGGAHGAAPLVRPRTSRPKLGYAHADDLLIHMIGFLPHVRIDLQVSLREVEDVVLKDWDGALSKQPQWPLLVDMSGQALTFLKYALQSPSMSPCRSSLPSPPSQPQGSHTDKHTKRVLMLHSPPRALPTHLPHPYGIAHPTPPTGAGGGPIKAGWVLVVRPVSTAMFFSFATCY